MSKKKKRKKKSSKVCKNRTLIFTYDQIRKQKINHARFRLRMRCGVNKVTRAYIWYLNEKIQRGEIQKVGMAHGPCDYYIYQIEEDKVVILVYDYEYSTITSAWLARNRKWENKLNQ